MQRETRLQFHYSVEDGLQKGHCEIHPIYVLIVTVVAFKERFEEKYKKNLQN